MTVQPHWRVSALGTLPGNEIFSFGFSVGKPSILGDGIQGVWASFLEPNQAVFDDIAQDVRTFWESIPISSYAALKSVKIAPIGTDGRYAGPSSEVVLNGSTGALGNVPGVPHPNQIALAVTLHSSGDIGRVKGRFYLPLPGVGMGTDGTFAEANRDVYETAAATLVSNVNNQPGIDVLDLRVVVASSGRKNADGSVRLPPGNWDVDAVSVGRVLDTIRRRRNKLPEYRGTPTAV